MRLGRSRQKPQKARKFHRKSRSSRPVFSYRSSRRQSEQPLDRGSSDARKKETGIADKRSWIVRLQYGSILLLVLFGVGYLSSLGANAQIKIDGSESFPRAKSEYTKVIQDELSSSVWNRSKLTLNSVGLAESIKNKFPEIRYVEVETSLLRHRPIVNVVLANPTVRLVTQSKTYVLDNEGRALFEAGQQSNDLDVNSLIPIVDNSGHPIEIGKPAITEHQINYITELIGQMKKKNISIRDMSLAAGGAELLVHFSEKDYFVKFSFMADARLSSGAYLAIADQNIEAEQYIDIRIPGRAYIK